MRYFDTEIIAALGSLDELINTQNGTWNRGHGSICLNNGADSFENEVFALRTYCWCDGSFPGHEDECPPNFEHFGSGVKITWYKHVSRGLEFPDDLSHKKWLEILLDCHNSLTVTTQDVKDMLYAEATSDCEACGSAFTSMSYDDQETIPSTGKCRKCYLKSFSRMVEEIEHYDS